MAAIADRRYTTYLTTDSVLPVLLNVQKSGSKTWTGELLDTLRVYSVGPCSVGRSSEYQQKLVSE